jgi:hypothetical protein
VEGHDEIPREGIDRAGWTALIAGAVLAGCILPLSFASYVFSYFGVLVHEMGHALAGWFFGYPSIPAFDFVYGGGITSYTERAPLLAAIAQGALLWLAWIFRRNPPSLLLALAVAGLYALAAWTPLHDPVITAMGHGAELIVAGVFLHRAASGRACHHGAERVAYGFVGWFVTFDNLRFARRLVTSPFHREMYEQAKGGGHWMDFSVLAEQYLRVPLESVALAFFGLCLLAPALAILANHYAGTSAALIARLRRI